MSPGDQDLRLGTNSMTIPHRRRPPLLRRGPGGRMTTKAPSRRPVEPHLDNLTFPAKGMEGTEAPKRIAPELLTKARYAALSEAAADIYKAATEGLAQTTCGTAEDTATGRVCTGDLWDIRRQLRTATTPGGASRPRRLSRTSESPSAVEAFAKEVPPTRSAAMVNPPEVGDEAGGWYAESACAATPP